MLWREFEYENVFLKTAIESRFMVQLLELNFLQESMEYSQKWKWNFRVQNTKFIQWTNNDPPSNRIIEYSSDLIKKHV